MPTTSEACPHCHDTGVIIVRCEKCERQFVHSECIGYTVECFHCDVALACDRWPSALPRPDQGGGEQGDEEAE